MKTGIDDKLALVTASTQGIGFATARLLAEEGATVWVHGRGGDNLQHALQRIRQAEPGARVNGVAADLAADGGVARLLEQVPAVDILVNGYADTGAKMLADVSAADWDSILHNNLATTSAISTHQYHPYCPPVATAIPQCPCRPKNSPAPDRCSQCDADAASAL
ncbi:MAG: SDR family NAD(P)-dependent oxidoreductase [Caldilineaceae bacterium]|nr:SDR family NAD(P)-dependent oxidoreductase [Caldilineaceae bacterium]